MRSSHFAKLWDGKNAVKYFELLLKFHRHHDINITIVANRYNVNLLHSIPVHLMPLINLQQNSLKY